MLAELREQAQVEMIVCAVPVQTLGGWMLDGFHADDLGNASRLRRLLASYLVRAGGALAALDLQELGVEQRNMLLDLRRHVSDDTLQASRICLEVLRPLQLHRRHVIGSVLRDGDSFLGWFAVFHPGPIDAQQRALLERALPALQRRLALERRLDVGPLKNAALDAVLEHIPAPALIVTSSGRLFDANEAGRAVFAARRSEVSQSILAAFAHEAGSLPIDLTSLEPSDASDHWLAVVRLPIADSWLGRAVARTSATLELTRRQREILARIIAGETDAAIAEDLSIMQRTVEQHVNVIFERAAVANRAALVAHVLRG